MTWVAQFWSVAEGEAGRGDGVHVGGLGGGVVACEADFGNGDRASLDDDALRGFQVFLGAQDVRIPLQRQVDGVGQRERLGDEGIGRGWRRGRAGRAVLKPSIKAKIRNSKASSESWFLDDFRGKRMAAKKPKPEGRNPKEGRRPKVETLTGA